MKKFVLAAAVLAFCPAAAAQEVPEDFLKNLRAERPRLMLHDARLAELKKLHKSDKTLQKYVEDVLVVANAYREKGPLVHRLVGPRLLHVSRDCLQRVYSFSMAYRWTGNEAYAARAKQCLLEVCAFPDWNPSHFLDTAEMSHAVGIGYDWLHDYLGEEARGTIRKALIELGMKPALATQGKWYWTTAYNWNQVCHGGIAVGALAIADTDPEYAQKLIPRAVKLIPNALKMYEPDGAWAEGPAYWHYATRYTAYGLWAMETALGTDFGLSGYKGLMNSGLFPLYTAGPTELYFNFADAGAHTARRPMSCLFWISRKSGNAFLADDEHEVAAKHRADPGHLIWYVPPSGKKHTADLDRKFEGPVGVAVLRSSWEDPEAIFVAAKAGFNQVNHGNLDLGTFVLDALGKRWACDLGAENYNLPGYWDKNKGGKRWTYYRMRSVAHNVPIINEKDQDPEGKSSFVRFHSRKEGSSVVIDLTSAYGGLVPSATRGIALVENRRAVLVQDEFVTGDRRDVEWGMMTEAKVDLKGFGVAELSFDDKKLVARILWPENVRWEVASAEQEPPLAANKGVQRLFVRTGKTRGNIRVAILLSPGGAVERTEIKPLADW